MYDLIIKPLLCRQNLTPATILQNIQLANESTNTIIYHVVPINTFNCIRT